MTKCVWLFVLIRFDSMWCDAMRSMDSLALVYSWRPTSCLLYIYLRLVSLNVCKWLNEHEHAWIGHSSHNSYREMRARVFLLLLILQRLLVLCSTITSTVCTFRCMGRHMEQTHNCDAHALWDVHQHRQQQQCLHLPSTTVQAVL